MSEPARELLPDGRVRLAWAEPSPRLRAAVELRRRDGALVVPVDRRGRVKAESIRLVAPVPALREVRIGDGDGQFEDAQVAMTHPAPMSVRLVTTGTHQIDEVNLTASDWRFILGADRRTWNVTAERFGSAAVRVATALAEAGVVELVVPLTVGRSDIEHPVRWHLTPAWAAIARDMTSHRAQTHTTQTARALDLAAKVHARDPGLADALTTTAAHSPNLPIFMAAAQDLLDGVTHDGPRAFSQTHFGHTKAREDAPERLRAAGTSESTLDALGLRRSPYVGLGGPVNAAAWDVSGWPGPVQFRADPHRDLNAHLAPSARTVLLVENLQAAETVCDQHPDVATVWFAGQPATTVVTICAQLAAQAADCGLPVLIAPDADLGGVRIAARLLEHMPAAAQIQVIDAGTTHHGAREPFGTVSLDALTAFTNTDVGPHSHLLHQFASAVIARGYPVEQESTIRAAITTHLQGDSTSSSHVGAAR